MHLVKLVEGGGDVWVHVTFQKQRVMRKYLVCLIFFKLKTKLSKT